MWFLPFIGSITLTLLSISQTSQLSCDFKPYVIFTAPLSQCIKGLTFWIECGHWYARQIYWEHYPDSALCSMTHVNSVVHLTILQIDAHEDDVNAVAFADSSSQLLFSGSDDALCKVWDRRTLREDRPQPVGHLAGHRDGITFIHSKV